jgi:hypothetical protein
VESYTEHSICASQRQEIWTTADGQESRAKTTTSLTYRAVFNWMYGKERSRYRTAPQPAVRLVSDQAGGELQRPGCLLQGKDSEQNAGERHHH